MNLDNRVEEGTEVDLCLAPHLVVHRNLLGKRLDTNTSTDALWIRERLVEWHRHRWTYTRYGHTIGNLHRRTVHLGQRTHLSRTLTSFTLTTVESTGTMAFIGRRMRHTAIVAHRRFRHGSNAFLI